MEPRVRALKLEAGVGSLSRGGGADQEPPPPPPATKQVTPRTAENESISPKYTAAHTEIALEATWSKAVSVVGPGPHPSGYPNTHIHVVLEHFGNWSSSHTGLPQGVF